MIDTSTLVLDESSQNCLYLAYLRLMDLDIAASKPIDQSKRLAMRTKLVEKLGDVTPPKCRQYSSALDGPLSSELSRRCQSVSAEHAAMILSEVAVTNPWDYEKLHPDVKRIALKELATYFRLPNPEKAVDYVLDNELPKRIGLKKVALVTLFTVAGGLVLAPHVGAAIGAAMGLSGAAATSAGLAALGFGSVAAGGFGMAGGTIIVGAVTGTIGAATSLSVAASRIKSTPELESLKLKISLRLMLEMPAAEPSARAIIETIRARVAVLKEQIAVLESEAKTLDSELSRLKDQKPKKFAKIEQLKSEIRGIRKGKVKELEEEIDLLDDSLPGNA